MRLGKTAISTQRITTGPIFYLNPRMNYTLMGIILARPRSIKGQIYTIRMHQLGKASRFMYHYMKMGKSK